MEGLGGLSVRREDRVSWGNVLLLISQLWHEQCDGRSRGYSDNALCLESWADWHTLQPITDG